MELSIDLDFGFSYRVASAPGKVLMTGGYLVLERPNAGIVLSTNARFYAIVKPLFNINPDISVRLHDNSLRFILHIYVLVHYVFRFPSFLCFLFLITPVLWDFCFTMLVMNRGEEMKLTLSTDWHKELWPFSTYDIFLQLNNYALPKTSNVFNHIVIHLSNANYGEKMLM